MQTLDLPAGPPDPHGPPPRLSWRRFLRSFAPLWEPGDHLSILAPTKAGKSFLTTRGLLPLWDYTLTFDVKNDGSVPVNGRTVGRYPSNRMLLGRGPHHYRLAPPYGARARYVFDDAMRRVWAAGRDRDAPGSWVVNLDELRVMSDKLKMRDHIETMYVAGRSRGITIIGSAQAPRDVPSEFYDQATWYVFGPFRDLRTLRRNAEIGGDVERVMAVVPTLRRELHEFYVIGPGFEAITALPPPRPQRV